MPWLASGYYLVFAAFVAFHSEHARAFHGASRGYRVALIVSSIIGILTAFAFLGYCGFTVAWWLPILLFLATPFVAVPVRILGTEIDTALFSIAGFGVWPVCAYLMFHSLPGN
jgi:hypothetical protein